VCNYRTTCISQQDPVKNQRIALDQSSTARMPSLMASSAFSLGRRC